MNNQKLVENSSNFIESYYNQDNRYYHNLIHLEDMCKNMIKYFDRIDFKTNLDSDTLKLSLILATYFHDIIYETDKNERTNINLSLSLFDKFAKENEIDSEIISIVKTLIKSTINRKVITLNENIFVLNKFFLDLDIFILGSHNSDYQKYSQAIRQEYSQYKDIDYKSARIKILKDLHRLAYSNQLYNLSVFIDRNNQARMNLADEIMSLSMNDIE